MARPVRSPALPVARGMTTTSSADSHGNMVKLRSGEGDGRLFPVAPGDIVRGSVLTSVRDDGTSFSFSDCVIADVYGVDRSGNRVRAGEPAAYRMVRLARPYIYISGANTACPTVLQGFEDYDVFETDLTKPGSHYRVRVSASGTADLRVT
jgi:hypothetical protein